MHAYVNQELCTGCGLCADSCPEVFQMQEATAVAVDSEIPADSLESAREAQANCPVEAITIR
jgi:ferredoxin